MSDDLVFMSACEAITRFRDRSLSPVELTEAIIARADATEPLVNAFSYTYFDQARAAAKIAELSYLGKGEPPRPLEGLCVAVKDSGHIKGQPTSAGSLLSDDTPQSQTSPINQRVLDAGAIVHARSTTPEYSSAVVTWSRRWGITRNPWNPDITPGGSSGGAAATLAAGSSTLATGSDIGGSIRVPASCCGVVGYKPPRGRNPVDP
ncbi:MAG: amidase, partial [Pseudomonadota bacterium]